MDSVDSYRKNLSFDSFLLSVILSIVVAAITVRLCVIALLRMKSHLHSHAFQKTCQFRRQDAMTTGNKQLFSAGLDSARIWKGLSMQHITWLKLKQLWLLVRSRRTTCSHVGACTTPCFGLQKHAVIIKLRQPLILWIAQSLKTLKKL